MQLYQCKSAINTKECAGGGGGGGLALTSLRCMIIIITVPSRKRAHGRCILHWAKIGGWADIRGNSVDLGICNVLYIIWNVRAILTYRVYRL